MSKLEGCTAHAGRFGENLREGETEVVWTCAEE